MKKRSFYRNEGNTIYRGTRQENKENKLVKLLKAWWDRKIHLVFQPEANGARYKYVIWKRLRTVQISAL